MTGEQHSESGELTPTRRHALKLAAGSATALTLGTTSATAQEDQIFGKQTKENRIQPQDQDRIQWTFETGDDVNSSPTVVDGTVFVGSNDNNLYAVDAETGTQQWVFESSNDIVSSPTVVDSTVFVGSRDANLYALDAETGTQQWAFQTDGQVESSPTMGNGTVFVGSEDGNLYAVDADTGQQRWAFQTGDDIRASSPTVVDDTVFVGSNDSNLYAVDAETGTQQWVFQAGSVIFSSPTVAEGTVFVGSADSNLYAVDAETGDQRWAFQAGGGIYSSPTVVDGTVFVGSEDRHLYSVDADTGQQQWTFETETTVNSSPTVVDGTAFVGSFDNKLYAVNTDTGDQQWAVTTGNGIFSSPTVVDGTLFVGSDDNNLYTIDADVDGSSEGSRVRLNTLGHHGVNNEGDDEEPSLFNLTVDSSAEAVAGSDVTISVNAQAVDSQISAFQINPEEQADHVNDFSDLSVTTTAETQIEDPGFVVYSELQEKVTVEWTGTIPENAEAGETFTLAGDALDEPQNRQLFSQTVTVTDDPLEKYRNENGKIDDTGLLEAISDWRDDELEDTQLLELISEWRDAGGNVEALPTGSLPNVK